LWVEKSKKTNTNGEEKREGNTFSQTGTQNKKKEKIGATGEEGGQGGKEGTRGDLQLFML